MPVDRTRRILLSAASALACAAIFALRLQASPASTVVMDWQFDGEVRTTARVGDVLYVGGNFQHVTPRGGGPSTARVSLAEFDATTGALLPATIVLNPGEVRSFAVVGRTLYATGAFGTVNGIVGGGMAFAFDVDTATARVWAPQVDNTNMRIVHADAAGVYIAYGNGLVRRYDLVTAAMDPQWLPELTANIVVADGELWASRPFPNFSVNPAQGGGTSVGVLDPVTGLFDERLRTSLLLPWHGLVIDGDTVYVAGQAPDLTLQVNEPDIADRLVAFDRGTGVLVSPALEGDIDTGLGAQGDALALADGRLIAAGRRLALGATVRLGAAEIAGPGFITAWTGVTNFRGQGVRTHGDLLVTRGVATDLPNTGRVVAYRLDGVAPPSGLRSRTVGGTTTFTWTAASPVLGGLVVLEGGTSAGQTAGSLVVPGTSTALSLPGSRFFLRVRVPGATETSNEIVAGCVAAPRPPSGLIVTVTGSTLSASWTAPPGAVASYTLAAGTAEGMANLAQVTLPAGQTTVGGAVPPGTYHLQVRASNACGVSGPSASVRATVGAAVPLPQAPTALETLVFNPFGGARVAQLSWTAPPGAVTGYRLEFGTSPGLANLATLALGPNTVFQIANPPSGDYYVRVRAVNDAGTGPPPRDVLLKVP